MNYVLGLDGGLGDCLFRLFAGGNYSALNELKPEDTCEIHIFSHCPSVKELFDYHPKKDQLKIFVHKWYPVTKHSHIREHNNIPEDLVPPCTNREDIIYPSEEDLKVIGELGPEPFVVIAAVAGGAVRNIPIEVLEKVYPEIRRHGFKVVVTGRSYDRMSNTTNNVENRYVFGEGTINLVDKLSLTGSLYLLSKAAGIITCHSSMCLFNWFVPKKPNYVFYPDDYARDRSEIVRLDPKQVKVYVEKMYCFGMDYDQTYLDFHGFFNPKKMEEFLCKLR